MKSSAPTYSFSFTTSLIIGDDDPEFIEGALGRWATTDTETIIARMIGVEPRWLQGKMVNE